MKALWIVAEISFRPNRLCLASLSFLAWGGPREGARNVGHDSNEGLPGKQRHGRLALHGRHHLLADVGDLVEARGHPDGLVEPLDVVGVVDHEHAALDRLDALLLGLELLRHPERAGVAQALAAAEEGATFTGGVGNDLNLSDVHGFSWVHMRSYTPVYMSCGT